MVANASAVNAAHLDRVSARISRAILDFCRLIAATTSQQFHMEELLAAVRHECGGIAPDSPSRVLRDLKAKGLVSYEVLNRRQSLYLLTAVRS